MIALRWPRLFPHRSRRKTMGTAGSAAVIALTVGVVVAAYLADGYRVQRVSLNDGGVWVTSRAEGAIGRFNKPVGLLDSRLVPSAAARADLDVLQQGSVVFAHDLGANVLRRVDVAAVEVAPQPPHALPNDAKVAMGGDTVAVLEPATGKVWARTADSIATLNTADDPATAVVGAEAVMAVGANGTVHVASASTHRLVSVVDATSPSPRQRHQDIRADFAAPLQITAVGDQPVVADTTGRLVMPDGTVTTLPDGPTATATPTTGAGTTARPGADPVVLQQPGPAADTVLVATGGGLYTVGLSDHAAVRLVDGTGGAAAPVRLGRCAYGAWSGRPRYARRCQGGTAQTSDLERVTPGAQLRFRVNRDVIVLNELANGWVFDPDRGGANLGDWAAVRPASRPDDKDKSNHRDDRANDNNRPPVARPDRLFARAGRSATLNVLDNDGDPDGDILVVTEVAAVPAEAGRVAIVQGGQAIQFTANPTWTAPIQFGYHINDGKGGTDRTDVTLTPRLDRENSPPRQIIPRTLTVVSGGQVTANVLRDWRDDDSDQLVLGTAMVAAPETVRSTPDGELTFTDSGTGVGRKTIHLAVGDGRGANVTADLPVDVVPAERDPLPVANEDLVRAVIDTSLVIRPLDNDVDPGATAGHASRLRLTGLVGPVPAGTSAVVDHVAGTITFTAARAQAYYLDYEITNGANVARSRIRIDVRDRAVNSTPVAVADRAAVRGTTPVEVDLLANDVDEDGDVLVVRSVEVPANAGLTATVRDHRWLRITPTRAGEGTIVLRYTVCDGSNVDTGVVEVTRLAADTENQPPAPRDDLVKVRVGNTVDVDVLGNDSDPEGGPLELLANIVSEDSRARWLVAGRTVRLQAPMEPGTIVATYSVRDDAGRTANAQVTATVVAADPQHNQPPRPVPIEARAFAGTTVRIPVPLAGADPDGDSVTIIGAAQLPKFGRIIGVGPDYLDFEAYSGAGGTEEFTYQLRDSLGARGTGTVRIGVVPRPERSSPPLAIDDRYTVAPGAVVRVPVLANDSDPDGDPLRLEPLATTNAGGAGGARIDGDRVVVTAGRDDGDMVTVQYGVSDGRGQRATAAVTLVARDGANLPPTARDDIVTEIPPGQTSVTVDVLANDDDLDGTRQALTLDALGDGTSGAVAVTADRQLTIAVTDVARVVAYRITDRQGGSAVAFVRVPAGGDQLPRRRPQAPALVVASGGQLAVDLADQLADPEGAQVRLTSAAGVTTSPVPGMSVVPGSLETTRLKIAAAAGFFGPAALAVEVTDRAGDVPERTVVIVLPVTVTPPPGQPLAVSCPAAEPQAGGAPVLVELGTCVTGVTADDRARLRFTGLDGVPKGVTAKLAENGTLTVQAAASAPTAQPGAVSFRVSAVDGRSLSASVDIQVHPAGLAAAVTDVVSDVRSGDKVTVDVTANDSNPFPGTPLSVVGVQSQTAGVSGEVAADKRRVTVTVAGSYNGRAVLTYQIQDASGQADRVATGRIEVVVSGKPQAPGKPSVRSSGNATAVLEWREPADNGAPITGYEVSGGTFSQRCPATVCALTGLDNGQRYHFTVRATNAVGTSDPSPASDEVRPDVRPDPPAPPSTTFADGAVNLSWTVPGNAGSAVQRYQVEISPAVGGGPRETTGTSLTWGGLTNGTGYAFRVKAFNQSDLASDWSALSAPEVPARAPEAPAAPGAVGVADGVGQQMVVTWSPPESNGAAITAYHLTVLRAGSVDRTISVDGDLTQTTVSVVNGVNYTFALTAVNKAGESVRGAVSTAAVAHGRPAAVTALTVSDNTGGTGYDRRLRYDLTPPNDNGMAISRYEFNFDGGSGVNATSASSGGFLDGLANGRAYRVRVRACNDMCGDFSELSAAATPYGPVGAAGVGAAKSGSRQVRLSWSPPAANGRPISRLEIRVDSGGWENVGAGSGERTVGNGPSETHSVQVRAFDSAGQVGPTVSAGATTDAPVVTVGNSGISAQGQPHCDSSACRYLSVQLNNFPANSSVTCTFDSQHGSGGFVPSTLGVDGGGDGSAVTRNYYGYPGEWVSATCNGVRGQMTFNP